MKRRKSLKNNNSGMSLVELIVVVLIIGVVAAASSLGISYLKRMDSTGAAGKLESMLERTRLLTLSSGESETVKLQITRDNKGYKGTIYKNTTILDQVEISDNSITLTIFDNGVATGSVINIGDTKDFTFNKSNGSFASTFVTIEVKGNKTVKLHLVLATGRCYQD